MTADFYNNILSEIVICGSAANNEIRLNLSSSSIVLYELTAIKFMCEYALDNTLSASEKVKLDSSIETILSKNKYLFKFANKNIKS